MRPWVTEYFVRAMSTYLATNDFTAIIILENMGMDMHCDVHNEPNRDNILVPLEACCGSGWIESEEDEYALDTVEWRRGRVHHLRPGKPIHFSAQQPSRSCVRVLSHLPGC